MCRMSCNRLHQSLPWALDVDKRMLLGRTPGAVRLSHVLYLDVLSLLQLPHCEVCHGCLDIDVPDSEEQQQDVC